MTRRTFDTIASAELGRQLGDISRRIQIVQDLSWASLALIRDQGTHEGCPPKLSNFLETVATLTLEIAERIGNDINQVL